MSDDQSARLRRVSAPASEPVTVNEAKLFLRIEHAAEDAPIGRAIAAAREACEYYLESALLPQQLEWSAGLRGRHVRLGMAPATAIDGVVLVGASGSTRAAAETEYRLSLDGTMLLFEHAPDAAAVRVTYAASLATTAEALPALLKQGILHHVAAMMELRDGMAPMPLASLQCYQPFRRVRL